MIAIKITNKKDFMSKLLTSELFDNFFLEEATIDTFNSFHIDGHIHQEFYKEDTLTSEESPVISEFSRWGDVRSFCFELIKGKRTPIGFKFTLHPEEAIKSTVLSDSGLNESDVLLGLNIRFANGSIILTTGIAYKIFTLDKTIEKAWDEYIPSFLNKSNIEFEDYA